MNSWPGAVIEQTGCLGAILNQALTTLQGSRLIGIDAYDPAMPLTDARQALPVDLERLPDRFRRSRPPTPRCPPLMQGATSDAPIGSILKAIKGTVVPAHGVLWKQAMSAVQGIAVTVKGFAVRCLKAQTND
jgi:hypothetical protein